MLAWAAGRFTAGAALLALAGPTAPDVHLALPGGRRRPWPDARPPGAADPVGPAAVLRHHVAADSLPLRVGVEVLRRRLVDRAGAVGRWGAPWASVTPVGADRAVVVVGAAAADADREAVEEQLRALLDGRGADPPTAAELSAALAPGPPGPALRAAAAAELTGRVAWPGLDAPGPVSAEAVAAAVAALVAGEPGGPPPVPPPPGPSPGAAVFRSRGWFRRRFLHVAEDAVVLVAPGEEPRGVSVVDCVAVRWWHRGDRVLVDRAGHGLAVLPADWDDPDRLLTRLDAVVAPGLFVCQDRDPLGPVAGTHPVLARLARPPVRPPLGGR